MKTPDNQIDQYLQIVANMEFESTDGGKGNELLGLLFLAGRDALEQIVMDAVDAEEASEELVNAYREMVKRRHGLEVKVWLQEEGGEWWAKAEGSIEEEELIVGCHLNPLSALKHLDRGLVEMEERNRG
jgi:hypothetical protein